METVNASVTDASEKVCNGCRRPIEDQFHFTISPDTEWHVSCLLCFKCNSTLEGSGTCFMKEGRPYCRRDYVQLFGIQCAGCDSQIQPNDLVMRAKNQVFHMECFKCSSCDCKLLPGDQYGISNGRLLCRSDLDVLCEGVQSPTDTGSGSEGSGSGTVEGSGSGTVGHKAGSIKRQNSEKGPRVRTVLTEQQLQTLRNVYAANPRPDALLKEHLVERTGLSSRVIRVWFQNKRCKDKKRAIQQAEARLQQTMPPLTPQTPLTPDTLGQISPRHGMASFTYSPSAYDLAPTVPHTPSSASPIVSCFQHTQTWGSPTSTYPGFASGLGRWLLASCPQATEHQEFMSAVHSSQTNHFAF
eukprot:Em0009g1284a